MPQAVRDQFAEITKRAIQQFVSERISDRLKAAALAEERAATPSESEEPEASAAEGADPDEIETTEDELQAYYVVKAVLSQVVNVKRIAIRDHKTYCAILLDDNNRKPICRLWFNTAQKYLGVFDADKNETRHPIDEVDEIFAFGPQLTAAVRRHDSS